MKWIWLSVLCMVVFAGPSEGFAQSKKDSQELVSATSQLEWRNIGPFRGGRSAAVTGVSGKPNLYYMGTTGGGVWRTKDGGQSWYNISDGFFGGSIGAVTVSESDPNIIFAGGGEVTVRGNVSFGNGIWKSTDAGKTWNHKGLKESRHIPRIRIHPTQPQIVYAAVLGDLFKSSSKRGVYKSFDGGNTWKKVLFVNDDAGAVDLVLAPNNPRILYASMWRVRRTPYSLESGGEGSGLWKSTDSGETWEEISSLPGLPKGPLGIIGVSVSPVNSNRVYALIEAKNGGLFRSDNAGETWQKINDDRSLRQRAWYYTRVYADTQDEDIVYVLNVKYHKSKDGGKSFKAAYAPHGDHHDLWIAPEDNQRMIMGDDGGGQVTFDGGANWSTYENQPTAQFYRVTTDNHFPYRIYGAQQDNSAIRIDHRSDGGGISERNWESTAGGESAHLAIHPKDNDIVVGGSYDGYLTWFNHKSRETRAINVWPDNPMGHGAEGMKYRFQWNFPVFFSPHAPHYLYTASNHLHRSMDMGQSWQIISPDLTRNDPSKLGSSGGPITQDNTSVEYYCTIFAAVESPQEAGLIWVGSDDGLVHITQNGGTTWESITPKGLPEWAMINSIEVSPHVKGGAYLAATLYKTGDYRPFLFKTTDYGKSWELIVSGIDAEHFTRVIRADPIKKGLLYAGTEGGLYYSVNDGRSWESFQMNVPLVPITDLTVKGNDLIAATQGRSFWVLDDLHIVRQEVAQPIGGLPGPWLFAPADAYRIQGGQHAGKTEGKNPANGVKFHYFLPAELDSGAVLSLEIMDKKGAVVRTFSTHPKEGQDSLKPEKGLNTLVWDLRYPKAKDFKGMVLWWASLDGPRAIPDNYTAGFTYTPPGGDPVVKLRDFKVMADPRSSATQADFSAQFTFLSNIRNKLTETHEAIAKLRTVRTQIEDILSKLDDSQESVKTAGKDILKEMKTIEEALYQTQNRSRQDPLNFPVRLNNKLGHLASLVGMGDFGPTDQDLLFYEEVTQKIDAELAKLTGIFDQKIPQFNKMLQEKAVPHILLEEK